MNNRSDSRSPGSMKTRVIVSALASIALGAVLWTQATADATPLLASIGSSDALGTITVKRITLLKDNGPLVGGTPGILFDADAIEVDWDVVGGGCLKPEFIVVEVKMKRKGFGGFEKSQRVSGSVRSASIKFGDRLRSIDSVEVTVSASVTAKAEGRKSQRF